MNKNEKLINNIICPVCNLNNYKNSNYDNEGFEDKGNFIVCKNNHTFDRAKDGYFNLALSSKDKVGDNKEMVLARKNFLNKGYYDILAKNLFNVIKEYGFTNLIDVCCGEGYFTNKIKSFFEQEKRNIEVSGFDLSKSAISQASKNYKDIFFFVANIKNIPIKTESVQCLMHLFAPINGDEFKRILNEDGIFVHVFPAKRHLWQLKEVLYETPYENDENGSIPTDFKIIEEIKVHSLIKIENHEDISCLFAMTPYAFRTPEKGKKHIDNLDFLETEVDFIINICKKY
ncbi:MAG: rlmA [Clostridia bacterium]|nr:rlmA [Clostridia bacterium]